MNFSIPYGASQEAVDAIVQRGVDAMFDAQLLGEAADVAFMFEEEEGEDGEEEGEAWEEDEVKEDVDDVKTDNPNAKSITDAKSNSDNNLTMTMEEWVNDVKEEIIEVCADCEEERCVFVENKESLVAYDEAEHVFVAEAEDVPTNNIRRKKLYRQLTLMLNGGPLGAGVRKELPACCVTGIREMFPSDTFMGFKAE
jgi:hypothetical protein